MEFNWLPWSGGEGGRLWHDVNVCALLHTFADYLAELPDPMSTIYGNSSIDKAMTVAYNSTRVGLGRVKRGLPPA